MKPRSSLLFLWCSLVLLGSCTPKVPPPPSVDPSVAVPAPVAVTPAPVAAPPEPTSPPAALVPVPAVPVSRPFDESLIRGREFLLEVSSSRQVVLRDPNLGPLGQDQRVTKVVEGFFHDAEDGTLEDPLAPRWAAYLRAWAHRYHTAGWGVGQRVSVGEGLVEKNGILLVPVRVWGGDKPPLQGWIALVKEGDGWSVSDVQVVESAARTDPFDPEVWGQEISSPSLR